MNVLSANLRVPLANFELDVQLEAPQGVTALFGPSGCGKTTTLRCLAGLTRAPVARISLGEDCWQDESRGWFKPAHARACGYVFQEASLFPHLSVRRNLEYGWKRVPATERRIAMGDTVDLLGIGPLLERMPDALSGGERQRVAMARALLTSPRLLLMDEPLASLDEARKAEVLYYIERLRDEMRLPIIYVSHSVEEVVRLADQVVVLAAGQVVRAGPLAGNLPGASVIETRVAGQDLEWGLTRLAFSGGELYAADVDALVGERVRVRIRAQDVALALSRPSGLSMLNILAASVRAVEGGAGASVDVRLDVAGTELVARVTRKSLAELGIEPGKRVFALVKSVAIDRLSVGYA